jgi:hypothetical protein
MKLALKREKQGPPARSPTPVQVACGRQDVASSSWQWRVDVQNAKIRGVRTPSAGAQRSKGGGGKCANSRNSGCHSPVRKERLGTGGSETQAQPPVVSAASTGVTAATPQTAVDSSSRGGGGGGRKLERVEVTEHASTGGSSKGCKGNGEKTGDMVVKQLSSSMVRESTQQGQADHHTHTHSHTHTHNPAAECRDLTQTPPRQSQAGRTGSFSIEHTQDLERLSPLLLSPSKPARGALGGVGGGESARSASSALAGGAPSMSEKDAKFLSTSLPQAGFGGTAVGWANLADRKPGRNRSKSAGREIGPEDGAETDV